MGKRIFLQVVTIFRLTIYLPQNLNRNVLFLDKYLAQLPGYDFCTNSFKNHQIPILEGEDNNPVIDFDMEDISEEDENFNND